MRKCVCAQLFSILFAASLCCCVARGASVQPQQQHTKVKLHFVLPERYHALFQDCPECLFYVLIHLKKQLPQTPSSAAIENAATADAEEADDAADDDGETSVAEKRTKATFDEPSTQKFCVHWKLSFRGKDIVVDRRRNPCGGVSGACPVLSVELAHADAERHPFDAADAKAFFAQHTASVWVCDMNGKTLGISEGLEFNANKTIIHAAAEGDRQQTGVASFTYRLPKV